MAAAAGVTAALPPARAARAVEIQPWSGPTPPLALRDASGREHRLSDFRARVLLVNFWATWCEPCRDEMPSIEKLAERMEGKPFAVLAVNLGESEAAAKKFLDGAKLRPERLLVLFDKDRAAAKAWEATILPASYLVDATGRVRFRVRGEVDWSLPASAARIESLFRGL